MKFGKFHCAVALCVMLGCGAEEKKKNNGGTNNATNNGANNGMNNGINNGMNNGMNNGTNNGGPCPQGQVQAEVNGELGCYSACDEGECPTGQRCTQGLCLDDSLFNNGTTNNAQNNTNTGSSCADDVDCDLGEVCSHDTDMCVVAGCEFCTADQICYKMNSSDVGSCSATYDSCDEGGFTSCFDNTTCEATERCQNLAAQGLPEVACCVRGARGAGTTGDACSSDNDCETSICIERNDDPAICSESCGGPGECPEPLECHEVLGLCVTPGE